MGDSHSATDILVKPFLVPEGHTVVLTADDTEIKVWVTCSCGFDMAMMPADTTWYVQRRLNQAHGWL